MPSREVVAATTAAKTAMQEITAFILRGENLSPFTEAVLLNDLTMAERLAIRPVLRHNIIPELRDWIDRVLPAGFLENGHDDVERWIAHGGLPGAPRAIGFWLYTFSNHWDPKKIETAGAR